MQRSVAVDVGRVRPVVEQSPEVDQRLAERGHVPVEDRRHPIRVARVELAVVDLVVVVQHRRRGRPAGIVAARRSPTPAICGTRPVSTSSHRLRQPATWRSTNPSGRPRSPSPIASGSRRWRSARASTTANPMRRAGVDVVGHRRRARGPRPRRRCGTRRRGSPTRSRRGRRRTGTPRGARSKCGDSASAARYSRRMSWAPGASWPNGGRRTTSSWSPKLTRYVRFAEPFGNCSTLERAVELGQLFPEVRLEAWPVEVLAGRARPRPRRRARPLIGTVQPSIEIAPSGQLSAASRAAPSRPVGTSIVCPRSVTKPSSSSLRS